MAQRPEVRSVAPAQNNDQTASPVLPFDASDSPYRGDTDAWHGRAASALPRPASTPATVRQEAYAAALALLLPIVHPVVLPVS